MVYDTQNSQFPNDGHNPKTQPFWVSYTIVSNHWKELRLILSWEQNVIRAL
jgi:hypothetical protein